MVEPLAAIRPVELADQKFIRFLVGKAGMEPIAVANSKMYTNPLVLASWVGLSSAFVQVMGWWPSPELGIWGYLSPIPAFATLSIAFMFAADWLNRWVFEDHCAHVLHRPDLVDIPAYYSRSPSSGFWVLQYGEKFLGLIALDASPDADSDEALAEKTLKKDKSGKAKVEMSKGTTKVARIRHFYVDEQYRSAGMQDDLLEFALKHAFTANTRLEAVRVTESPLTSYISKALRKQGFQLEKKTERVGALRWQTSVRILEKSRYIAATQQQS